MISKEILSEAIGLDDENISKKMRKYVNKNIQKMKKTNPLVLAFSKSVIIANCAIDYDIKINELFNYFDENPTTLNIYMLALLIIDEINIYFEDSILDYVYGDYYFFSKILEDGKLFFDVCYIENMEEVNNPDAEPKMKEIYSCIFD